MPADALRDRRGLVASAEGTLERHLGRARDRGGRNPHVHNFARRHGDGMSWESTGGKREMLAKMLAKPRSWITASGASPSINAEMPGAGRQESADWRSAPTSPRSPDRRRPKATNCDGGGGERAVRPAERCLLDLHWCGGERGRLSPPLAAPAERGGER